MAKPSFINLWNHYVQLRVDHPDDSPCDGPWDNQCAIRMSIVLNKEGSITIDQNTYSEPKCAHGHARGAESLAGWLWKHHLKRPTIYTSPAAGKRALQTKQGILFFKDCFTRSGETVRRGDHIDLWHKGLVQTYDDPGNKSSQLWFWELT